MTTVIPTSNTTFTIEESGTYYLSPYSEVLTSSVGIGYRRVDDIDVIIAGSVISQSTAVAGLAGLLAGPVGITIAGTGLVQGAVNGVTVTSAQSVFSNAGNVAGLGGSGVDAYGDGSTISNTGVIFGNTAGIETRFAMESIRIANAGDITGGTGILFGTGDTDGRVFNSGSIVGTGQGNFGIETAGSGTIITNSGMISGDSGAISGSAFRDVIFNSGVLGGDVVLDGGDDLYRAGGDGLVLGNVRGGGGNDDLRGARAADELLGGNGNDKLRGREGEDTLEGGNGRDIIYGGDGDDEITGGNAGDLMLGGAGADVFLFTDTGDIGTTGATRDEIRDFEQGADVINLGAMVGPDFIFLGTGSFTGGSAPELRLAEAGGSTFVQLDYDGDGTQDGRMLVRGVLDMTEADFIL